MSISYIYFIIFHPLHLPLMVTAIISSKTGDKPKNKFVLDPTWTNIELNKLINKLNNDNLTYIFSINNEILNISLNHFIKQFHLSNEEVLHIEYFTIGNTIKTISPIRSLLKTNTSIILSGLSDGNIELLDGGLNRIRRFKNISSPVLGLSECIIDDKESIIASYQSGDVEIYRYNSGWLGTLDKKRNEIGYENRDEMTNKNRDEITDKNRDETTNKNNSKADDKNNKKHKVYKKYTLESPVSHTVYTNNRPLSACWDGTIAYFNLSTNHHSEPKSIHNDKISHLDVINNIPVTSSWDFTVKLLDPERLIPFSIWNMNSSVTSLLIESEYSILGSCTDGYIKRIDIREKKSANKIKIQSNWISKLTINNNNICCSDYNGFIRILDSNKMKINKSFKCTKSKITTHCWLNDSSILTGDISSLYNVVNIE
eukprot:GHVP01010815.1.p1 GENE.GHVP01010815.1~~GHVP01010815.1.p1  ORF type:complete len:428 (+),score=40.68 GHVP01010815.1:159-1442(+)